MNAFWPPPSFVHTNSSFRVMLHLTLSYHLHFCVPGAKKLVEKIKEYNPKIAVFNGKGIYEVFSGEKEFIFGKQPQKIADTDTVKIFVITTEIFLRNFCDIQILKYLNT